MPLLRDNDLVRIDLPAEGEFAMVKRKLSRGDRVRVEQAIVGNGRLRADMSPDLLASDVVEAAVFATLDIAVRQLHVHIGEGGELQTLDATPDLIRQLDGDSVDAITERLNELNPVRTEAERLDLNGRGQPSRKARAGRPES